MSEGLEQYGLDSFELITAGIDIGSATSQAVYSRLVMERDAQGLSSQYRVARRDLLHESRVILTPYLDEFLIDADALIEFFANETSNAGFTFGEIDSGAVILTGTALERRNAREIADRFERESGEFVCAAAGHHMETLMSAHGSGSVALQARIAEPILHLDMGGGTTKVALIDNGEIIDTASIAVGSRLVAWDEDGLVTRVEPSAKRFTEALGRPIEIGEMIDEYAISMMARRMVDFVISHLWGDSNGPKQTTGFVLEPATDIARLPRRITFAGGVSDLFSKTLSHPPRLRDSVSSTEPLDFGDLGWHLAGALVESVEAGTIPHDLESAGVSEGIRATVVGLSQFTVEASGSTVHVSRPDALPLKNLSVTSFDLGSPPPATAARDLKALVDGVSQGGQIDVALDLRFEGRWDYESLTFAAKSLVQAWAGRSDPLVVIVDGDVARSLGRLMTTEQGFDPPLVVLDGLTMPAVGYLDVGRVQEPSGVVRVVVKSMLFDSGR